MAQEGVMMTAWMVARGKVILLCSSGTVLPTTSVPLLPKVWYMTSLLMRPQNSRATCLMIGDLTPLHLAAFNGWCPDATGPLLDAEAQLRSGDDVIHWKEQP